MTVLIDVRHRTCGCGHAGAEHRQSTLGIAAYGGLGPCTRPACDCLTFRVHAASRYTLVWHPSRSHALNRIGAFQPPCSSTAYRQSVPRRDPTAATASAPTTGVAATSTPSTSKAC